MLVSMRHTSEGSSSDVVTITSTSVTRLRVNATCYSGVRFHSNGTFFLFQANNGTTAVNSQWLVNGAVATFYVSRVIDSGTLTTDAGAGPLQMNSTRDYVIQQTSVGTKTTTVTFNISDMSGGSPIIGTAQFILSAEYSSGA